MLDRTLKAVALATAALTATQAIASERLAEAAGTTPRLELEASPATGSAPDPLTPPEASGPPPAAPGAPAPTTAASPAPAEVDPIVQRVRELLAAPARNASPADKGDRAGAAAFYADGGGKPIWVGKDGLTPRGQSAIAEIRRAEDWGLRASAFELPAAPAAGASAEALAEAELKLSLAVLEYARHARGGRLDPTQLSKMLDRKPQIYEPRTVLAAIALTEGADAYLRELHPKHEQFRRLRSALLAARGRPVDAAPVSNVKLPAGPKLKPGDTHAHVALLRQRLAVAGEAGKEAHYDSALVQALKTWQQEHAQQPDGIVGNTTRSALNGTVKPASSRDTIQRIVVNMERWRWMPDDLGSMHVVNNVPEQMSRVYKDGKVVFNERIVVGKPVTPTPTFTADMQFVIFHPEWGVPDGIKTNEIAPKLRQYGGGGWFGSNGSSDFLGRHNLRVMQNGRPVDPNSVNWNNVDIRRYQFIQPSGGKNVLGVVKFRFPNKHDVYMHDTQDKQLFAHPVRAYSHGCMRVQNPVRLAELLLAHDKGFSPDRVRSLVDRGGSSYEVKLSTPVPVHVVYFTATVDDDGKLRSHGDLYGMDSRIASVLEGKPVHLVAMTDPDAKVEREVKPVTARVKPRPGQGDGWGIFSGLLGN